jgi:hypothetical protein
MNSGQPPRACIDTSIEVGGCTTALETNLASMSPPDGQLWKWRHRLLLLQEQAEAPQPP